jgi:FAD-dependent urate hydroxylase
MINANLTKRYPVTIVGAGPNGLSAAAFLRAAGTEVNIFGNPMDAWKDKMPQGMVLRSTRESSNIASPGDELSIRQYELETGNVVDFNPTLEQFIAYGEWFLARGVPDVDRTRVKDIRREPVGFTTELEDGRKVRSGSVVVAPGILPFPYVPVEFAFIPKELATHSSEITTLERFENKDVAIIGKGQSALETSALLRTCGAHVEIITRGSELKFIPHAHRGGLWRRISSIPEIHQFLYPPTDLAGPPDNWAIADPVIYRSLSRVSQAKLFEFIGPIGSTYLEEKLAGVSVTTRTEVREAKVHGERLCLVLSNGSTREVDHVILATGFHPNIDRLDFLSDELKAEIQQVDHYPELTLGYESVSVKGLYFLGALSTMSQGPINRFVCGTSLVGQYLTEAITGSKIGYPNQNVRRLNSGRTFIYRMFQISGRLNW